MGHVPQKLKYSKTHEWIHQDDDIFTVGITDHAQYMLGELIYIELPEVESSFEEKEECGLLESMQAAADIFCPVAGEIVEINEALLENPQLANDDPYGKGWLFKVRSFENEAANLLSAKDYIQHVASEAH